ncbi:hypothetical protein TCAL_08473 [Tigriopus californicus]|uniref:Uncharacterized protein n=1 Tax=Tigriopus californicus TaxID=6832 RepID=A0A553N7B3_TIGCA|nr:guanine nucleotide exchange factor for Rab-3A-like [Tigriopus californicus]TRY61293.1 hypothetical protein TCAL_08473 [Tigriopus californicus]|eukprot:TCALIF_08473-PA protein Name:"Similar to Rab3il1 Guanine nucleotide exchange factor for Rab-3A (Mus musculus)" AED:0.25 eAED:0.49 QI:0/-1/0/1/-1/1/1/0/527
MEAIEEASSSSSESSTSSRSTSKAQSRAAVSDQSGDITTGSTTKTSFLSVSSSSSPSSSSSSNLLLLSVANLEDRSLPNSKESNYQSHVRGHHPTCDNKYPSEQVGGGGISDFDVKPEQCCLTLNPSEPSSLTSNSSSTSSTYSSSSEGERELNLNQRKASQLRMAQIMDSASSSTSSPSTSMANNNVQENDKGVSSPMSGGHLEVELKSAKDTIKLKDLEIAKLSRIRQDVESELEDLTASLFEEAHKMVRDANVKQASAEKVAAEAHMKIEGLETEVAALKTLVLTSTPSQPNKHLHPQLDPKRSKKKSKVDLGTISPPSSAPSSKSNSLNRGCQLESGSYNCSGSTSSNSISLGGGDHDDDVDGGHTHQPMKLIDPILRKEFISWKKTPTLETTHPFMERIYQEDIHLCLAFVNRDLSKQVLAAIQANTVCLDPVKDFSNVPRDCALLQSPVLCKYVLKLNLGHEEDHFISQLARNRIASVCDCINYLRYIVQGLVKSHVNDVYWEVMHLRGKMALARLGFSPD